ncbi:TATA box-binding protein-associated factor RNA polymerase I subunit B [Sinocyclocheilus anshuiensis]|uniref:TATA box-binding protein-associated factor RNA polymerase I subunit B n=1 Tax=Sinocyclocheilus anshuiensis TaxID=1608454 RepID=A0A671QCT2_9TELE|nr:PREDICTED: TATA box-binding protein-associated factor RNA polymerase I subunit B [Sinocyclocheilus anshuiensis]
MDEQLTDGYSEPCGQCAAVNWGVSDEGQFFCRSCHNVIEKTREVVDVNTLHSKHSRISQITRPKKKRPENEREWMICEGFQFILKHQAKALVSLGVCMKFETEVLWNFWKRYLQNTQQAFTRNPVYTPRFMVFMKSQSDSESNAQSEQSYHTEVASEMSEEMSVSGYSSEAPSSVCSGSLDAVVYQNMKGTRMHNLMTMPRTLALCYLALLWVREAITLADLLRMVSERCVPYMNIHEAFPAELSLFGKDVQFFNVRYLPSYSLVHKEAVTLARILQLPSFPTVSKDCLLHPFPLTVRYLLEANLPNDLHVWVHKVIRQAAMGDSSFLTFEPSKEKPHLLRYDIQAVAVIIVTLKLLFKLDDHVEWKLSEEAAKKKKKKLFKLKKWFDVVQPVLEQARKREEREEAQRQWGTTKPFITSLKRKSAVLKKRRVAKHLEQKFQKFTDSAPEQSSSLTNPHASFHFSWGKEEGSDGPSMYKKRLDCTLKKDGFKYLCNRKYWHPELRLCPRRTCGDHFSKIEPSLPRMYVWVLDLFSFILGVHQAEVHKEVLSVERRFLKRNHQPKIQWTLTSCKNKKKRSKTATHVVRKKTRVLDENITGV